MQPLSTGAGLAWEFAGVEALQILHQNEIGTEHIFLGIYKLVDSPREIFERDFLVRGEALRVLLMELDGLKKIAGDLKIDVTAFRREFRMQLEIGKTQPGDMVLHRSAGCKKMFAEAEKICLSRNHGEVSIIHLLLAMLREEQNKVIDFIKQQKIEILLFTDMLTACLDKMGLVDAGSIPDRSDSKPKTLIKTFGRDITELVRNGKLEPIVGRNEEIKALAQTLGRKTKNNAILIGEPGVGKTAVVEGLAQEIVNEKFTGPDWKSVSIVEINVADLMAGTKYRGELEERVIALLKEAEANPDIVIFIDEIHTIMQTGGGGAMGMADILKPALQKGNFRCIGATTFKEYRKYIETDTALQRRFQPIIIEEPSKDRAIEMLMGIRASFEKHHEIKISDEAVRAAVELSIRYMTEFFLPDKAIDLIDEAATMLRIQSRGTLEQKGDVLQPEHIAIAVSKRAGVPYQVILSSDLDRVKNLKEELELRVIGQPHAVEEVSSAIIETKALGGKVGKPAAVFLFVGATGTGKTEMAKALADILFWEKRKKLITFDMSEFMEEHSVSKLIGAPPGYVGFDSGGQLIEQVRKNPYSIVLFDEIEKAHPKVFDIFLQILDEARLTDSSGRKADFQNTIIIMTSNVGSQVDIRGFKPARPIGIRFDVESKVDSSDSSDFDKAGFQRQIFEAMQAKFRPEFLGRIPHKIHFYPLQDQDLQLIIRRNILPQIEQRFAGKKISLRITDGACGCIIAKRDMRYGLRSIMGYMEQELVNPLIKGIVDGRIEEGNPILVDAAEGRLIWRHDIGTERLNN